MKKFCTLGARSAVFGSGVGAGEVWVMIGPGWYQVFFDGILCYWYW